MGIFSWAIKSYGHIYIYTIKNNDITMMFKIIIHMISYLLSDHNRYYLWYCKRISNDIMYDVIHDMKYDIKHDITYDICMVWYNHILNEINYDIVKEEYFHIVHFVKYEMKCDITYEH